MASTRGIDAKYAGPPTWLTWHLEAAGLPENPTDDQKKAMVQEIRNKSLLFPCPKCRTHLAAHLQKYPPEQFMTTRTSIFKYTVDLHNIVNKMLNKPVYDADVMMKKYDALFTPEGTCRVDNPQLLAESCEHELPGISKPNCDLIGVGVPFVNIVVIVLGVLCGLLLFSLVGVLLWHFQVIPLHNLSNRNGRSISIKK